MTQTLDIFKVEEDGSLVWKGTAENLEIAKLSVKVLIATSPADSVVFSQATGHKTVIKADGSTNRQTLAQLSRSYLSVFRKGGASCEIPLATPIHCPL